MSAEETQPDRYRFGPLERRGLIAGWRGGQLATVGAGLVVGVLMLRAEASVAGALGALVALALSVALATWPVGGRTLEEWAPDAVRFAAGTRRRPGDRIDPFRSLYLATLELDTRRPGAPPTRAATSADRRSGAVPPATTGHVGGAAATDLSPVGVVIDRTARTYTVSFVADAAGFVLLSPDEQCRRVEAWSGALGSLARERTAVHRVQWASRSLPAGSGAGQGRVPDAARPGASGAADAARAASRTPAGEGAFGEDAGGEARCRQRGGDERANGSTRSAALRSYEALQEIHARTAPTREVLVSVSIHAGRAARAVRAAGGGERGACTLVLREAASLRRRLVTAGIRAGELLGPEGVENTVRAAFSTRRRDAPRTDARGQQWPGTEAAAGAPWAERRRAGVGGSRTRWPWPMAVRGEWGRVLVEATWHATYWISEWPRTDVGPEFLAPLLLLTGVRHAVSVVMEPVGPVQAARRLEQARTADIADAELRRRGGFLATARRRREEQVLARREAELADGHAPFRFSGYVTVSGADPDVLDEACALTEQAAARCGLELRLCYGDQARAFTATLPFCRGLA